MTGEQNKVLALITARGGSKGLPGKNILPLDGKPLIAWSIDAAKASHVITDIVVTTDDEEIAKVSREAGARVPFIRPPELASDTAGSKEVVLHALESLEEKYDYVILLQPTSPLRTARHIDEAFNQMLEQGAHSCVGVKASEKPAHLFFNLNDKKALLPLISQENAPTRRQDAKPLYAVNGAIYIFKLEFFQDFIQEDTIGYIMGTAESVDIDDAHDFAYVQWLVSQDKNKSDEPV